MCVTETHLVHYWIMTGKQLKVFHGCNNLNVPLQLMININLHCARTHTHTHTHTLTHTHTHTHIQQGIKRQIAMQKEHRDIKSLTFPSVYSLPWKKKKIMICNVLLIYINKQTFEHFQLVHQYSNITHTNELCKRSKQCYFLFAI